MGIRFRSRLAKADDVDEGRRDECSAFSRSISRAATNLMSVALFSTMKSKRIGNVNPWAAKSSLTWCDVKDAAALRVKGLDQVWLKLMILTKDDVTNAQLVLVPYREL